MTRRIRRTVALVAATAAIAAGCALPADGDSGEGSGGGGLEVKYCEQDHRGDLNEARCYDNPTRDR